MSKSKLQTTSWKERRRFHAIDLKNKDWKQREIATALDVSEGAVSRWLKKVDEQGKAGLCARPHTGRPPQLTREEKRLLPDFLGHGAEAIWISWSSVDLCPCPKSDRARVWSDIPPIPCGALAQGVEMDATATN